MLVKCKKFSVIYPTGPQRIGDIFELNKKQADFYAELGWVEILPKHFQSKNEQGKLVVSIEKPALDLSKNKNIYRGERIKKSELKNEKEVNK